MDWSQASWFESWIFGLGIFAMVILCALIAGSILFVAHDFAKRKVARLKRMRKTTRALRCDVCDYNVEDDLYEGDRRCKRFGVSITHAPVRIPGCSWGYERKEDDK